MMKKLVLWLLAAVLMLSIPLQAFAQTANQITQGGGQTTSPDGVTISKTITPFSSGGNVENYFDIELKVTIQEQKLKAVSDYSTEIAMVLDISNTMNADVQGDDQGRHRIDLVREGLKSFVTAIAKENPGHVYLTLIVFNTDATRIVNEYLVKEEDQYNTSALQKIIANLQASDDGQQSDSDYGSSYKRFTNVEGGLQLAYNNLRQNPKDHQYVILMSDGFPTTYNQRAGDQGTEKIYGYNPYTTVERTLRRYDERYSLDQVASVVSSVSNFKTGETNYNASYYGWRGYFADPLDKEVTPYGTNYSDWGAWYAQRLALHMKGYYKEKSDLASDGSYLIGKPDPSNQNRINIFSMGVDLGVQTVDGYQNPYGKVNTRDLMTSTDVNRFVFPPLFGPAVGTQYNHIIGSGSGSTTAGENDMTYENWLGYVISGGQDYARIYGNGNEYAKAYYNLNNSTNVSGVYRQIWKTIEKISYQCIIDTMVASDPMGEDVEFIGFYNKDGAFAGSSLSGHAGEGAEDTASVTTVDGQDTISWTLAHSGYEESAANGVTTRTYSVKYRVRLKNETGSFVEETSFNTNGRTTLTYRVDSSEGASGRRELVFAMPQVKGWLGELSFAKKDSLTGEAMPNVAFTLSHKWNCSVCSKGKGSAVAIASMTAKSNENGVVSFTRIPSGHQYTLKETVPPGYGAVTEAPSWPVEVHFNSTTTNGAAFPATISNTPQHNMIHVQFAAVKKLLNTDGFAQGKFAFELTLTHSDGSATANVSFEQTPGTAPNPNSPVTSLTISNPASSDSEGGTADVVFPPVHVFKPGTYRLTIKEVAGTDSGRIEYDGTEYTIDFTADADGLNDEDPTEFDMHITKLVFTKPGEAPVTLENENGLTHEDHDQIDDGLVFTNTHKTTSMQLTKLDSDTEDPIEGVVFTLVHQCEDDCGYIINDLSFTSDSSGLVRFEKIPTDHHYLLKETRPTGYTTEESAAIYVNAAGEIISGNLTMTDGNLGAVYNKPNYYKTAIAFGGFKDVNQEVNFPEGAFAFELYTQNANGGWDLSQTTLNGENDLAANHFRFEDIIYTSLGTHTYKIVEKAGSTEHMEYDPTEYVIEVTVRQGELYHEHDHFMMDISYRLYQNGVEIPLTDSKSLTELLMNITFSNRYFLPVDVPIQAMKTLDGRVPGSRYAFTFTLCDAAGEPLQAVVNNGSLVDFGSFRFEDVGTYEFTVREEPDRRYSKINFDKNVFTITVNVFEQPTNGHYVGQLGAEITYRRGALPWTQKMPVFKNQTIPPVTGDHTPLMALALMTLVSGAGALFLLRRRHG